MGPIRGRVPFGDATLIRLYSGHMGDGLFEHDGPVFTGDLTDPMMVGPEDPDVVRVSQSVIGAYCLMSPPEAR